MNSLSFNLCVICSDNDHHSLTPSEKCRKAHLDHVHKIKRDIWGRAALGMQSNFSTNPKLIVMKEIAYEKGVRLLEAEFGEYRDKGDPSLVPFFLLFMLCVYREKMGRFAKTTTDYCQCK